ncbi:MAG TPA: glycosyltransferase family 2 protein [Opitutaceae bacterium]
MSATVDILLATYNGAAFLPEQLESIAAQTHGDWRLIARDDGSNDSTCAILGEFRARLPNKVVLVEDAEKRLGAKHNFNRLMLRSDSAYVAFCDQDDIWLPNKLASLLDHSRKLKDLERPWLIHSDLTVVDERNAVIAPSFWQYQFIRPKRCAWQQQLVQSIITGCAMLFNRALCQLARPIPVDAVMHDWWLGLIAATSGEILWTNEATVRYRQHGRNDTGAKRWDLGHIKQQGQQELRSDHFGARMKVYRGQARALLAHRQVKIPEAVRNVIETFVNLDQLSYLQRRRFLLKNGILKTGLLRNLAMLWVV